MSKNYNLVKDHYEHHRWTKEQVHRAVGKWITVDEYREITGEDY